MTRLLVITLAVFASVSVAALGVAQERGVQVLVGTPVTWSVDGTPVQTLDVVAITGMSGNYDYSPMDITVEVGTQVTWDNISDDDHTVTSEAGGPLNSPTIMEGRAFSHVFTTAGTFEYFCQFHDMDGEVTVE